MPIKKTHRTGQPDGKRDELQGSILAGVAALDRGDYTEVEDADLDAYLDGLAAEASGGAIAGSS
ncbi:MAG: hypothetical protein ACREP8_16975 [Candidatus Binatia bacterium]